jgi:hypothetical protein
MAASISPPFSALRVAGQAPTKMPRWALLAGRFSLTAVQGRRMITKEAAPGDGPTGMENSLTGAVLR